MHHLPISIQGYEGSFHAHAARKYFDNNTLSLLPADSFDILANQLNSGESDAAVMAIENSIAGTILQNYRILREYNFWISGEVYLPIDHCLMTNQDTSIDQILQIISHPMALNQCLEFIALHYPHARLIESEDTALSAIRLAQKKQTDTACIASAEAARINHLKILHYGIQSNASNYTKFFILKKNREEIEANANKASLYFQIPDQKGQLLKILQVIHHHDLNMSKLQSFPVMGKFREYFFHIDIEFDHLEQYYTMKEDLLSCTTDFCELGIYKRSDEDIINIIHQHSSNSISI